MTKKWYHVCLNCNNAQIIKATCKLAGITYEASQDGDMIVLSVLIDEKIVAKFDDLLSTLPE